MNAICVATWLLLPRRVCWEVHYQYSSFAACFFLSCHVLMSHVCSRAIGSGGGIGTHNHKANNDMQWDALVSYVCAHPDVRLV